MTRLPPLPCLCSTKADKASKAERKEREEKKQEEKRPGTPSQGARSQARTPASTSMASVPGSPQRGPAAAPGRSASPGPGQLAALIAGPISSLLPAKPLDEAPVSSAQQAQHLVEMYLISYIRQLMVQAAELVAQIVEPTPPTAPAASSTPAVVDELKLDINDAAIVTLFHSAVGQCLPTALIVAYSLLFREPYEELGKHAALSHCWPAMKLIPVPVMQLSSCCTLSNAWCSCWTSSTPALRWWRHSKLKCCRSWRQIHWLRVIAW